MASKAYPFSIKTNRFVIIIFWIKRTIIWDRTDFFIFFNCLILGSFLTLCPRGLSKAKLYKLGSLSLLTILPLLQSHFKWTLSFPVVLMGFFQSYMFSEFFESILLEDRSDDLSLIGLNIIWCTKQAFWPT